MKTAGRENPNRWAAAPSNRAHGAASQNTSRSLKWAAKQESFRPQGMFFFLTSTFIELPVFVHHRRTSLDFPMRPQASSVWGERGISRLPYEVLRYVHGVSDRAGPRRTSRYRCVKYSLPPLRQRRRPGVGLLSRLNTRPALSLVNASTPPSRAAPHDSGPMSVASLSSRDCFIHFTSSVLPGAPK
jgi:hypothetical protein